MQSISKTVKKEKVKKRWERYRDGPCTIDVVVLLCCISMSTNAIVRISESLSGKPRLPQATSLPFRVAIDGWLYLSLLPHTLALVLVCQLYIFCGVQPFFVLKLDNFFFLI